MRKIGATGSILVKLDENTILELKKRIPRRSLSLFGRELFKALNKALKDGDITPKVLEVDGALRVSKHDWCD